MPKTAPQTPLELLTELVEQLGDQHSADAERLASLGRRIEQLDARVLAVANRVESVFGGTRPIRMSKRYREPMTCARCGGAYAAEPGPELCGPCWVALGRPAAWPAAQAGPV